ncbi:hypothetical protein PZA18_00595 [Chitinimonas sp. DQS-5]|uniref:ATP synthase protein I n=1 Tax=Parachitinimonas caeni TaxID=3031301 RepID=A0ABT7DR40_9NEIS|nr:hypothetical protein [Parachitinimonas caeni]
MRLENDNIQKISRPTDLPSLLREKINSVLRVMAVIVLLVAGIGLIVSGSKAMTAAIIGGLAHIAVVAIYGWVAQIKGFPAPKTILSKFLLAEMVKIVVAVILLAAGFVFFGESAVWFAAAFLAALAAYLLVLIFK